MSVERCPVPECDKPLHSGLHEDSDGFRWRQDDEAAQWAFEDATDAAAKERAIERALEGMP